jgi:hypothetical protein
MSQIGWEEIWQSLPRNPWFYIIFLGIYITLPLFQSLIFSFLWGKSLFSLFPPIIKKRIYNKDLFSYSGDIYVYFWAKERVSGWSDIDIMHSLKDNAIISSLASTIVAFGLLSFFVFSGYVDIPEYFYENEVLYISGAILVSVVFMGVGFRFRKAVFGISEKALISIFTVHIIRLLTVMVLQVLEWEVVVPEVDIEVWFTFLSLQIITGRIPFLPSRDLIFVAAGIELAGAIQVSKAAIAGVLGVHSVLDKGLNLILFSAVSLWDRPMSRLSEMEEEPSAEKDSSVLANQQSRGDCRE